MKKTKGLRMVESDENEVNCDPYGIDWPGCEILWTASAIDATHSTSSEPRVVLEFLGTESAS